MLDDLLKWFIDRIKEPSTHAVLAGLAGTLGLNIDDALAANILLSVAGLLAAFGIGLKEKKL